jgi:hypothetical protein
MAVAWRGPTPLHWPSVIVGALLAVLLQSPMFYLTLLLQLVSSVANAASAVRLGWYACHHIMRDFLRPDDGRLALVCPGSCLRSSLQPQACSSWLEQRPFGNRALSIGQRRGSLPARCFVCVASASAWRWCSLALRSRWPPRRSRHPYRSPHSFHRHRPSLHQRVGAGRGGSHPPTRRRLRRHRRSHPTGACCCSPRRCACDRLCSRSRCTPRSRSCYAHASCFPSPSLAWHHGLGSLQRMEQRADGRGA